MNSCPTRYYNDSIHDSLIGTHTAEYSTTAHLDDKLPLNVGGGRDWCSRVVQSPLGRDAGYITRYISVKSVVCARI